MQIFLILFKYVKLLIILFILNPVLIDGKCDAIFAEWPSTDVDVQNEDNGC